MTPFTYDDLLKAQANMPKGFNPTLGPSKYSPAYEAMNRARSLRDFQTYGMKPEWNWFQHAGNAEPMSRPASFAAKEATQAAQAGLGGTGAPIPKPPSSGTPIIADAPKAEMGLMRRGLNKVLGPAAIAYDAYGNLRDTASYINSATPESVAGTSPFAVDPQRREDWWAAKRTNVNQAPITDLGEAFGQSLAGKQFWRGEHKYSNVNPVSNWISTKALDVLHPELSQARDKNRAEIAARAAAVPSLSPMQQQQKEQRMQADLYAKASVIDPQESRRLEQVQAENARREAVTPKISTEDGRSVVKVPGASGEMSFTPSGLRSGASMDDINKRIEQSGRFGSYTGTQVSPEEQQRRSLVGTQMGVSADYVPVAERVNEINRQTRAVRNLRAANLGLNEDLFDLAGGDASTARQYQKAMAMAIARGGMDAVNGGGGGRREDGLMRAMAAQQAAAAKAAGKPEESFFETRGPKATGAAFDPNNPDARPTIAAALRLGREPSAAEFAAIGNQMGLLRRGFEAQQSPMAATPEMVTNLQSAEGSWMNPLNWFRDDTYYKGRRADGSEFETGFGYNPWLEAAIPNYRR